MLVLFLLCNAIAAATSADVQAEQSTNAVAQVDQTNSTNVVSTAAAVKIQNQFMTVPPIDDSQLKYELGMELDPNQQALPTDPLYNKQPKKFEVYDEPEGYPGQKLN